MTAKQNLADLHLAFDVGHSSIGWAVLRHTPPPALPEILGTGVVIFGADDCLASKRRQYRQQRRHARATRKRIELLARFLFHRLQGETDPATTQFREHLKPYLEQTAATRQLQGDGDSFAWQRAAEILAAARENKPLPDPGWSELWDILRWYAHNRGYFAPPWANRGDESAAPDTDDEVSDTEKVEHANDLMRELGTRTMAETVAAYTARYEREAAEWQQGRRKEKPKHFKGLNAAFLRDKIVWPEVRALLTALKGRLPGLDDALIRTLLGNDVDPLRDRDAWRTIPCPDIQLPKRYHGGLLFGQVIPRFENRIIGVCPIWFSVCQDLCLHHPEITQDDPLRREKEAVVQAFEQWLPRAKKANERLSPEKQKSPEALIAEFAAKQSKLPAKASPEFLRFRWAMQLANVFGAAPGERETRPLTADERKQLTARAEKQGAFTKGEFKQAVREIAGWLEQSSRDNLDALLLHPDAEQALIFEPVQAALRKHSLAEALLALPPQFLKRLRNKLTRGKEVKPQAVRDWLGGAQASTPSASAPLAAFDAEVQRVLEAAATRRAKKQTALTRDTLLAQKLCATYPKGRAPYARPVLRQAYEEVMQGWDPRAEKRADQPRGCLCQTDELKEAQLQRRLEEQTNNHLIRHRLLILERLQRDLIAAPEFANGDKSRIAGMTIEVASDLRDLSGKTRKEQEQDLGLRLGDFKRVAAKVEEACKRRNLRVTAGIIRKARVAEDLGWRCPYTGKEFCIDTLLDGVMDKEHIIPHADRQSDSLDSLVITWNEVNKWKGKRTAMEFIREEGGKPVPGRPELEIMSLAAFQKHVASLDTRKGHDDDRARKKRRIRRLLTEHYEEKEFTPRDLTVTSHLVRLGAQVLQRVFPKDQRPPVVSLPGSVTGEVRKAWRLTGCLEAANPAVMEEVQERNPDTGELQTVRRPKKKDEIRGITHLHHALDACVLALAAHFFPRHGTVWATMVKAGIDREADDDRRLWLAMTRRRPTPQEAALLKATGRYQQDSEGRLHLADLDEQLKQQIRARLAEKRVVQHVPADMSGVKTEENTRRVLRVREDGRVELRQQAPRDAKTGVRPPPKTTEEAVGKLLGLNPANGGGKLKRQKGVRVITDNFGVAILDHAPEGEEKFAIIPWHRVWYRLQELKAKNDGKMPRVLRNGQIIRVPKGTHIGDWRIFSAKNNADGIALALGRPDAIVYSKSKQNVKLRQLLKDDMTVIKTSLPGVPALPSESPA